MCVKKRGMRSKGDIWWCNEEVKEVMSRKKDAHKSICKNSAENRKSYTSMTKSRENGFKSNDREG